MGEKDAANVVVSTERGWLPQLVGRFGTLGTEPCGEVGGVGLDGDVERG
jgi:hypothetical protein